jgi:hypothetical protein
MNRFKADVIVLIESVYSMDGDVAPVRAMLRQYHQFGARSAVDDEAHGLGIYGNTNNNKNDSKITVVVYYIYTKWYGVLAAEQVEQHPALACSIHLWRGGMSRAVVLVVPYSVTGSTTDIRHLLICRCILAVIR